MIGKEYKYLNVILLFLFEGEYKEGKKYKGKVFNYFGEIIFDEDYKKLIRTNSFFKLNIIQKIVINNCIYSTFLYDFFKTNEKFIDKKEKTKIIPYEGTYKKGLKHWEGKEYNQFGDLIFEGIFNNGKRTHGKEYDNNLIIFFGEYKEGKKCKIKKYHPNGILQLEEKEEKNLNLKNIIMMEY